MQTVRAAFWCIEHCEHYTRTGLDELEMGAREALLQDDVLQRTLAQRQSLMEETEQLQKAQQQLLHNADLQQAASRQVACRCVRGGSTLGRRI